MTMLPIEGNPSTCKHCGGTEFEWFARNTIVTSVVQGRLTTHDVGCVFVLGCVECSETLRTIKADELAGKLSPKKAPVDVQPEAFRVRWVVDTFNAETPDEAAQEAVRVMTRQCAGLAAGDGNGPVLIVTARDGTETVHDLAEGD